MGKMTIAIDVFMHETAIVEPGASVGPGSMIWHHCHVRSGARIGASTTLGKNVYVDDGAAIGDNCKIQNNVSVYKGVTLEDRVFVGPSAVFTNDLYPRAGAIEWTMIPTLVRTGATIGANATILCGVVIGQWALIAAGAVVVGDVVANEVVAGNPARRIGWVCECGDILERTDGVRTVVNCGTCLRVTTI